MANSRNLNYKKTKSKIRRPYYWKMPCGCIWIGGMIIGSDHYGIVVDRNFQKEKIIKQEDYKID